MNSFFLALIRALTTADGSDGGFLSIRRKSHLLQARWYTQLAEEGEAERHATTTGRKIEAAAGKPRNQHHSRAFGH